MGTNKRRKALSRVVKLLNLATSDVNHEADLALTHAHSIIYNHNIKRYEIDRDLLCDRSVLELIDWYGDWEPKAKVKSEDAQTGVRTERKVFTTFAKGIREKNTFHEKADATKESVHEAAADIKNEPVEPEPEREVVVDSDPVSEQSSTSFDRVSPDEQEPSVYWDYLTDSDEDVSDEEVIAEAAPKADFAADEASVNGANGNQATSDLMDELYGDESLTEGGYVAFDRQSAEYEKESLEAVVVETVSQQFEADGYFSSDQLDVEALEQSEQEARDRLQQLEEQLKAAESNYAIVREEREQGDKDAETEKAIRIQAEIEAERAAERAFRLRAEAQQRWETEMRQLRQQRRQRERDALNRMKLLQAEQTGLEQSLVDYANRKAELQRLELIESISTHLQAAAEPEEDSANQAFEEAVSLMENNRLGLTDLPLEQIYHKSVFIRLLERESSEIDNGKEREAFTEALLGRYLELYHPPAVDLAEQVISLLKKAGSDDPLQADTAFAKAQDLLSANGMSIRDLDIGKIEQTSLFIRLLNWEADRLPDMGSREHFTAKMLDRYFDAILNS